MYESSRWLCCALLLLAVSVATATLSEGGSATAEARAMAEGLPGEPMMLTRAARQALQESEKAFPSDDAGFSAYYRVGESGSYSLTKKTVDDHIFSPLDTSDGTAPLRTAPATLVEVGQNYTVATLTLLNIDALESTVNLYYDDQGWIVAYLSKDVASALVLQAYGIDEENPKIEDDDIGNTILLDAINVVVKKALKKTAISSSDEKLGYYHWQFPSADNFLMMMISRADPTEYAVQFAVPSSITLSEISASMWVSQDNHPTAPCAKVTLDDSDLIEQKCAKGIYNGKATLTASEETKTYNWKLIQSSQDGGGSGSLMVIIYQTSS